MSCSFKNWIKNSSSTAWAARLNLEVFQVTELVAEVFCGNAISLSLSLSLMILKLVNCSKCHVWHPLILSEVQVGMAAGGTTEQFRMGRWCGEEQVGDSGKCKLVNTYPRK